MADRHAAPQQPQTHQPRATPREAVMSKLHMNSPDPSQLVGVLTFIVSGTILLLLTGLTVTATVLGLVFLTPLIVISSPLWIPVGAVLFLAVAGFLSVCSFGLLVVAGFSWHYKYFMGRQPPGSARLDYARRRIADTANQVRDYAMGYGGYLQGKVKDVAPGA